MSAVTLTAPVRIEPSLTLIDARFPTTHEITEGRYVARFARSIEEVDAALRLRFEIFNLEFGTGRPSSFLTGHDRDEFDLTSQHMILIDRLHRQVIGTWRIRTYEIAKTIDGFCSSREFDLSAVPHETCANAIEVDRVCIAKAHRNLRAHLVLWKGLRLCLRQNNKRYVFGSLSLATQDPMEGGRIFDKLSLEGHLYPQFTIRPRAGFKCFWYKMPEERLSEVPIPGWFRICQRFGTKLCGPPAINRQFRTINFPVFMDSQATGEEDTPQPIWNVRQIHETTGTLSRL